LTQNPQNNSPQIKPDPTKIAPPENQTPHIASQNKADSIKI
jgi:hypothetical protein